MWTYNLAIQIKKGGRDNEKKFGVNEKYKLLKNNGAEKIYWAEFFANKIIFQKAVRKSCIRIKNYKFAASFKKRDRN